MSLSLIKNQTLYDLTEEDVDVCFGFSKQRLFENHVLKHTTDMTLLFRDPAWIGVVGEVALHRMLNIPIDKDSLIANQGNENTAITDQGDLLYHETSIDVKTTTTKNTTRHTSMLYVGANKRLCLQDIYVLMFYQLTSFNNDDYNTNKTNMLRRYRHSCVFGGSAPANLVCHPFFSPFVRGVPSQTDITVDIHAASYAIPQIFLGNLFLREAQIITPSISVTDGEWQVPQTQKEFDDWFEKHETEIQEISGIDDFVCESKRNAWTFLNKHFSSQNSHDRLARRVGHEIGDPIVDLPVLRRHVRNYGLDIRSVPS